MSSGFFVPKSISENFVSTQKGATGANVWDQAMAEIGLGKQAALQTINKQYNTTIADAYSQYLLANRGVSGSNMGEGYKEAYNNVLQAQLANQVAQANITAAGARQDVNTETGKQQAAIKSAYETEVANLDRVYSTANDYLAYLKTLTKSTDMNAKYLTPDQEALTIDDMYDTVFQAQPRDYIDSEGNLALSYIEWVNMNLKGTDADTSWGRWLVQGGLESAKAGVKKGVKK